MEVSKSWKKEIETNPVLYNQALSNVKLKIKDEFYKEDSAILKSNRRRYKHLELIDCFEEEIGLIPRFSSMLESLTIRDSANFQRTEINPCKFKDLRILSLHHCDDSWIDWLVGCKFPVIKEFRYKSSFSKNFRNNYSHWLDQLDEILYEMDSITHLSMRTDKDDILFDSLETTLKLTAIDLGSFQFTVPKSFLLDQIETLTTLSLKCKLNELIFILAGEFENLETLSVDVLGYESDEEEETFVSATKHEDIEIPFNETIQNLKIQTDNPSLLHILLESLPGVTVLITYNFFFKNDVKFLGKQYLVFMLLCTVMCYFSSQHGQLAKSHMSRRI